ncbi:MAG: hypothetical protein IH936_12150 [Acidobacteria bacterium]|nr:hypothetical protein [Acidobacteriota bacterium]
MSKSLYLVNPAPVCSSYFGAEVFEQWASGRNRKPDSRLRLALMHV